MFIAFKSNPRALGGRQLIPRQDLIALEAHQALDPARDALGPR
jgi:hypothetical protein